MQLTYKFHHPWHPQLAEWCHVSKDLYNQALYLVKKSLKEENRWLCYKDLDKLMKISFNLEGNINYRLMPKAEVSQQILRLLEKDIKSYINGIKDWSKNKSKYSGQPKFPKYKKDYNILIYTNQRTKITKDFIQLTKNLKIQLPQWKNEFLNFNQVRVIPRFEHKKFEIEIIYTVQEKKNDLDKDKYCSIDLGINNLISCLSENFCILYSGKQLKSINQWYNKEIARLSSIKDKMKIKGYTKRMYRIVDKRNKKVKDLMHKISRHLVNLCVKNKIGNIVVGFNQSWKDSIKLGNKTNQTFFQLPYSSLLWMIEYKCKLEGITFIKTEESYTSKCDSLALEKLGFQTNYLGNRIKRGLFQSSSKRILNADINGSFNILRKVVNDSNDSLQKIIDRGLLFRPVKINNLFNLSLKIEKNELKALTNDLVFFKTK